MEHQRYRPAWLWGLITASAVGLSGCQHTIKEDDGFGRYVSAIDTLQQIHEKYGSITFSTPLLVPDGSTYFAFDLPDSDAKSYFTNAKDDLQGASGVRSRTARSSGVDLGVQADITQLNAGAQLIQKFRLDQQDWLRSKALYEQRQYAVDSIKLQVARQQLDIDLAKARQAPTPEAQTEAINAALTRYAEGLPAAAAPGAYPQYPTAVDNTAPAFTSEEDTLPEKAKTLLSSLAFAEEPSMLDGETAPKTTDRSALGVAAGNVAIEGMFKVLGEADKAQRFANKHIVYGVGMVSVQPGWVTRKGFEANIAIQVERSFALDLDSMDQKSGGGNLGASPSHQDACKDVEPTKLPAVAAVSPMNDVQNLDLANASSNALERAMRIRLALSYFGLTGGLGAFDDYIENLDKKIRTRTSEVPVAAYSTGHVFGYRVGPSLSALADPSAEETTAGYVLRKQSFPVLLIIGYDDDDLRGAFVDVDGEKRLKCKPQLRFTQTMTWVPRTPEAARHRLSEVDLMLANQAINDPRFDADQSGDHWSFADIKVDALRSLTNGSFSHQDFPKVATPTPRFARAMGGDIKLKKGESKKVTRIYLGDHLKTLDLGTGKGRVVHGNASVVESRLVHNAVEMEVEVFDARQSPLIIAFQQDIGGRRIEIDTPPIAIGEISGPADIPEFTKVLVADLTPVEKGLKGEVILIGTSLKGLDTTDLQVLKESGGEITGVGLSEAKLDGNVLTARFTAPSKDVTRFIIRARYSASGRTGYVLSPVIKVEPPTDSQRQAGGGGGTREDPKPPTVEYESNDDGKSTKRVMTIRNGASQEHISASVDVLKADLEKDKPPAAASSGGSNPQRPTTEAK